MTAEWDAALDAQIDAVAFLRSSAGARQVAWLNGIDMDIIRKRGVTLLPSYRGPGIEDYVRLIVSAEPIYVVREAMPLVLAAIRTWQPEPAFEPFIPRGFLALSQPISAPWRDATLDALAWERAANIVRADGAGVEAGIQCLAFAPPHKFRFEDARPWGSVPPATTIYGAITQPILRLLEQRVLVRNHERGTSHVRRRLARAKFPERNILVVRLRRPAQSSSGDHRDVEWTYRWLVSGHWRAHWFPSHHAHRQIWIAPYVKGPADTPLRVHDKRLWVLDR